MSRDADAAGAEDVSGKEKTPKGEAPAGLFLGHAVNNCMTVIL